ncbi:HAD family hydrolase [Candidatus Woesearchaeota archaeon]|nr:MAG: HAD family hydrolase [Candidatus Woesearchaeota archaeon]
MVKAIFFDLWGTLVETTVYPSPIRQVKYILGIQGTFQDYILTFEQIFMTKTFSSLEEGFREVCKAFDIEPTKDQLDQLIGLWNKKNLISKPYPETLEVLEKLHKKFKLVLISNTDCFSTEQTLDKFDMTKYFEKIVVSYKEGKLKSHPELFANALKELKIKKEDAIMIGDSIESDMEGAQAAGIKGILIDRKDRREYEHKIMSLLEIEDAL